MLEGSGTLIYVMLHREMKCKGVNWIQVAENCVQ
jgi:hypothetical protein